MQMNALFQELKQLHGQEEKFFLKIFWPVGIFYLIWLPSSYSADCSSASFGQRPGQIGRKHSRAVGDEQDWTGLDLWQGMTARMQHVQDAYSVCVKDNSPAADTVVTAVGCYRDVLHLFCALNAFCVSQLK